MVIDPDSVTSLAVMTLVNSSMATAGSDVRVTVNSAGNAIFVNIWRGYFINDTDGAFFTAAVDGQGTDVDVSTAQPRSRALWL